MTSRRRTLSQLASWFLPPTPTTMGFLWQCLLLRRSGGFDAHWYLLTNRDVAASGANPLLHYVEHGRREGRAPAPSKGLHVREERAAVRSDASPKFGKLLSRMAGRSNIGRDMSLLSIGQLHGTDKANDTRRLLHVYEERMGHRRYDKVVLLEIGVLEGASLRTWADYFDNGQIFGLDFRPVTAEHAGGRISVLVGSQNDTGFLTSVVEQLPARPDFIIDDGSHFARDQSISLMWLWPHLKPGGLYVIEDTHTSYMPDFDMAWRKPGSTMEFLKGLADDIHSRWHQQAVALPGIESISFYEQTCIIEKSTG